MKIAVFGASGKTGILIVYQALEKGHLVTAFSRNADAVPIRHRHLRVVEGDVLDYEKVREAVEGQDAVMSALGVNERKRNTVLSDGTGNILRAMKETATRRLICMSSAGILEKPGMLSIGTSIVNRSLKAVMADKKRQLKAIRESGVEWVVVLPPTLTDAPKTGKYRIGNGPPAYKSVPRADVADFMLKLLTEKKYDGKTPSIAGY